MPSWICLLMEIQFHFEEKLTSECPALIGTVPIYDSVIHYQRDLDTLTARDFIDVVRLHAQGWSGFCDTALWHHAQNNRADSAA